MDEFVLAACRQGDSPGAQSGSGGALFWAREGGEWVRHCSRHLWSSQIRPVFPCLPRAPHGKLSVCVKPLMELYQGRVLQIQIQQPCKACRPLAQACELPPIELPSRTIVYCTCGMTVVYHLCGCGVPVEGKLVCACSWRVACTSRPMPCRVWRAGEGLQWKVERGHRSLSG